MAGSARGGAAAQPFGARACGRGAAQREGRQPRFVLRVRSASTISGSVEAETRRDEEGSEEERERERNPSMEDLFRKVYRGDPGVPHSDPDRYLHSWLGSFAFAAVSWCTSRTADLSRRFKYVVSFCLSVSLSIFSFRVSLFSLLHLC
ncbi:hypothetical protein GW17_00026767 [Ensete ventricosum]|nr:hypothetical protein GW17_00026767 [Ensete ventricosum]